MTRRATFTKAELKRAVRAAREEGMEVVFEAGGIIRIVEAGSVIKNPDADLDAQLQEHRAEHGYD